MKWNATMSDNTSTTSTTTKAVVKAVKTDPAKVAANVNAAVKRAGTAFAKTEGAFAKNNATRVSIIDGLYRAVGLIGRKGKADTSANDVHKRLLVTIDYSVGVASLERYGLIARMHDARGVAITPESVSAAYKLYDNDRSAFMAVLKGTGALTPAALTTAATTAATLKGSESGNGNGGNTPQSIPARVASLGDVLTGSRGIKTENDRKAALGALAALTKRVEGFVLPTKAAAPKPKAPAKANA